MKNIFTLKSNELIEAEPTFYNVSMKTKIKNDIITDYQNGIKSGKITIFPSDFNNLQGIKVKDWASGELIKIDDVLRILDTKGISIVRNQNQQDVLFKVKSRNVIYEGQLLIELELQEVKIINE